LEGAFLAVDPWGQRAKMVFFASGNGGLGKKAAAAIAAAAAGRCHEFGWRLAGMM